MDAKQERIRTWREENGQGSGDALFEIIYDQSPVAIEIYDPNGKLIHANPACLDLFGVNDLSAVRGFDLFADPNVPAEARSRLARGQAVAFETVFDFELVKKHGLYGTSRSGKICLDCLITPMLTPAGSGNGYWVHARDVTERNRAQEELERVYELTPELLCVADSSD